MPDQLGVALGRGAGLFVCAVIVATLAQHIQGQRHALQCVYTVIGCQLQPLAIGQSGSE